MISILRSNQPIATGLAFFILLAGGGLRIALGDSPWQDAAAHLGWGSGAVALVHFLYTRKGFVERYDAAAAIWTAWFWAASPQMIGVADWRVGLGLLVLLASWRPILEMQRQASASHLGFVAGALTGVAALLAPSMWAAWPAALVAVLATRSFRFREFALLAIGFVWPVLLAAGVDFLWADVTGDRAGLLPVELPHLRLNFNGLPAGFWLTVGGWLPWGLFAWGQTQSALGLSTRIVRRNAWTVTLLPAVGALLWHSGPSAASAGLLAVAGGWAGALITPELGRAHDGRARRRAILSVAMWAVAVTIFVLNFGGW